MSAACFQPRWRETSRFRRSSTSTKTLRVQRFQYSDKANMDAEWAAIKNGGKVVSVSKPQANEAGTAS